MSGDYEVYCAICGGPLRVPSWDPASPYGSRYELELLAGPEDLKLAWLSDIQVIGEMPQTERGLASGPWGVWMSAASTEQGWNIFYLSQNELARKADPVLSRFLVLSDSVSAYEGNSNNPWSAPFHSCCRELFCRYLSLPMSKLNKEVFFHILKAMAPTSRYGNSLNIDYGNIGDSMRSSWAFGDEYFVFNPTEVHGLQEIYNCLPAFDMDKTRRVYRMEGDPFARLSSELLLIITSYMRKITTITKIRKASPAFANLELRNGWWKQRIHADMPWLWDLPTQATYEIDWKKAYHRFYWGSKPLTRKSTRIHGLCNRRRIWEQMCAEFAQPYLEEEGRYTKFGFVGSPVLNGIYARMSSEFSTMDECDVEVVRTMEPLLDRFSNLPNAEPSLLMQWTKDGYLADVQVLQNSDENDIPTHDLDVEVSETQKIVIPRHDWLKGFIVTTREAEVETECFCWSTDQVVGFTILFAKSPPISLGSEDGQEHQLLVQNGYFIVGLEVQRISEGAVCRIGLFEQPLHRSNGCVRVSNLP